MRNEKEDRLFVLTLYKNNGHCLQTKREIALQSTQKKNWDFQNWECSLRCPLKIYTGLRTETCTFTKAKQSAEALVKTYTPEDIVEILL